MTHSGQQAPSPHPSAPVRWRVGDVLVHRVDEVDVSELGRAILPDATPGVVDGVAWLHPAFVREGGEGSEPTLAVHTFAFVLDGRRVLVDTGVGNGKERPRPPMHRLDTPFLARLAAAGFPPDDVDLVINTHLHADHVGWNTTLVDGVWRPTFPHARHLVPRADYTHWEAPSAPADKRQLMADSVHPVRDAGLLDLVDAPEGGVEVLPGLRLLPAPGHTPGQVVVRLDRAGESALVTGDCLHHPVQFAHPDLASSADTDPAQATRTRRALMESVADTGTLVLGSHFAHPTAGYVRRAGEAFRFDPAAAYQEA